MKLKTPDRKKAPRRKYGNQRLHILMLRHGLDLDRVAEMVRVSPYTVRSWLRPMANASFRSMPDGTLELLCIKLGEQVSPRKAS